MTMQSSGAPAPRNPVRVHVAAWASFMLAVAGIILLILRNPLGSGAIASTLGVFLGGYAIRRGLKNHVGSQLGLNLGLFNLLLWFVLFILLQRMLGIDLSSIFTTQSG